MPVIKICNLKVDGGASRNNILMQFQADIINQEVTRPIIVETTALGVAYLSGLAVGFWKDKNEISEKWHAGSVYKPNLEEESRVSLYKGWLKAVEKVKSWED